MYNIIWCDDVHTRICKRKKERRKIMSEIVIMNTMNPMYLVGAFLLGNATMAAIVVICYMIRDDVLGRKEKKD